MIFSTIRDFAITNVTQIFPLLDTDFKGTLMQI